MSDQADRLRERVKAKGLSGAGSRSLAANDLSGGGSATAVAERPPARVPRNPAVLGSSGELPVWAGTGVDLSLVLAGLAEALKRQAIGITAVAADSEAQARIFVTRADPAAVMASYRAMVASVGPEQDPEEPDGPETAGFGEDSWRGLWLVAVQGYPGGPQVAQAVKAAAHTYRKLHVSYLGTLPQAQRGRFPDEAALAFSTAALRLQAVWGGDAP